MQTYIVTVAYYDAWNEQTLAVEAGSVDDACAKAVEIADTERVHNYQLHSWDPGATFVAGIAEGGALDDNDGPCVLDNVIGGPIPFGHSEEAVTRVRLLAGPSTSSGAGVLRDALKAALPELEGELEQREQSDDAEAIAPLRAIVAQVRSALGDRP